MNQQTFNYKPRPAQQGLLPQLWHVAFILIMLLSAYGLAQYITELGDRKAKAAELEQYRAKLRELNACSARAYAYPITPPAPAKRQRGGM